MNSLTKTVEPFRPLRGRTVRVYSCGPTVYDFAHIGNFRSYIFADTLQRVLRANGYHVRHVVNMTDVGHLTQDSDDGEDKVERAAAAQQKTAAAITAFYTDAFFRDLARLRILPAHAYPRATAYIIEQVALVRRLERRGFTYATDDGIYFDTAKFPAYGRAFGGQALAEKEAGARVAVRAGKRSPHDFALWKFSVPQMAHGLGTDGARITDTQPKRQQEWPSPWGVGFPGWHIECSVMSRAFLGQPFDMHTGGIDHIPIHHTNEIAQSETAYDKPLAVTWMHNAFLTVDGKRMGKSEGNLVTIDHIVQRGGEPLAYRYLCLGAHYRSSLNFTWEALSGAQSALVKLREHCRSLHRVRMTSAVPRRRDPSDAVRDAVDRFRAACDDDLDTPRALAVVWEVMKSHATADDQSAFFAEVDSVFGLGLSEVLGRHAPIPAAVRKLVTDRERARHAKDWARADILRAQVEALGWRVEDGAGGPMIHSQTPG